MTKKGKITLEIGAVPEKHELKTGEYFANRGYDVEFLKERAGQKTPDIEMCGYRWEIKSPKSARIRTFENTIKDAAKQSDFLIFDLRRISVPPDKFISKAELEFSYRKKLKRVIIIVPGRRRHIDIKR